MDISKNITMEVAEFALADHYDLYTEEDFDLAKVAVADAVCCALVGSREEPPNIIKNVMLSQGTNSTSTIIGMGEKASPMNASLVNGSSAHIYDFDDVHSYLSMHISVIPIVTALALGEMIHAKGKDCLMAILNGMQVSAATAEAVYPEHHGLGWHGTSTIGAFGGAATAGYLLRLTPSQMRYALGIVGSTFGGVQMNNGTMTKSFHQGYAAHTAIQAALLAQAGYDSNDDLYGSKFFSLLTTQPTPDKILPRLYRDPAVRDVRYKNYPCCISAQPAIIGVLNLMRENGISKDDIASIQQEIRESSYKILCEHTPKHGLGGKFSSTFCMSVAATKGMVDFDSFRDEMLEDPDIKEMLPRTKLIINTELNGTRDGITKIILKDGRTFTTRISLFGPDYTVQERVRQVNEKYLYYSALVLSKEKVEMSLEKISHLEKLENIKTLMELLGA